MADTPLALVQAFCDSWATGDLAAAGDVVLTERVDVFTFTNGRIALPVSGTFEVRDGRIVAWRDYFDMNQFVSQLPES